MTVRKIKSLSHASGAKPGELEFTLTTVDNKAHCFKIDQGLLKEFFLNVGAASLNTLPASGAMEHRVYFNEALGAVTLELLIAGKSLTACFAADTAEAIGGQLVEAAQRARSLQKQRAQ